MTEDIGIDADGFLVIAQHTEYAPRNEAEQKLIVSAIKLCGRCVNRVIEEHKTDLSLLAVNAAGVVAAHMWAQALKDLATGKLRGLGSREKAYRNIVRFLHNHKILLLELQMKQESVPVQAEPQSKPKRKRYEHCFVR